VTSSVGNADRSLPSLDLPAWLDHYPSVADEAESIYEGIIQKYREWEDEREPAEAHHSRRIISLKKIEFLCRLASDQRMKSVWRELYRKKRRPSNEFLNPAMPVDITFEANPLPLQDPKNQDMAVRAFFNYVFRYATEPSRLRTEHDIKAIFKPFTMMAIRLREDSQSLQSLGANKFASDLEAMAIVLENHTKNFNPGRLNPIVKRSRGDQVLRYFILLLSMRCRELFGKWLPGTVATAAGVVFSKKITGHQVRNLVRAHDPDGANP
jgi:hypothetical protein